MVVVMAIVTIGSELVQRVPRVEQLPLQVGCALDQWLVDSGSNRWRHRKNELHGQRVGA
jgi:hypothetical protein